MVSLARGHDPRDFVLFAFGGAGPLHAAAMAKELGIPKLLIPARPGITNALGCVVADLRHDFVNTVNKSVEDVDIYTVISIIKAQIQAGEKLLQREGVAIEGLCLLHMADMQFQGQTHMLSVALPGPKVSREQLQQLFEKAYWARFEVELPEIRAMLVNLHTAVIGLRPRLDLALLSDRAAPHAARKLFRSAWFEGGFRKTPVYQRASLPQHLVGPAIIEQLDCTTVLEPGNKLTIDNLGNLLISL
jgi:N-methylhydantoinase A